MPSQEGRLLQAKRSLSVLSPVPAPQNGASFLGNVSSILQQQEQAISRALADEPRSGASRGLLQVCTHDWSPLLSRMKPEYSCTVSSVKASRDHQNLSICAAVSGFRSRAY